MLPLNYFKCMALSCCDIVSFSYFLKREVFGTCKVKFTNGKLYLVLNSGEFYLIHLQFFFLAMLRKKGFSDGFALHASVYSRISFFKFVQNTIILQNNSLLLEVQITMTLSFGNFYPILVTYFFPFLFLSSFFILLFDACIDEFYPK